MKKSMIRTWMVIAAAAVGIAVIAADAPPAAAWVSPDKWDPGYIISDAQMYDGDAMSVQEIQAFLNSKVSVCETWRTAGPHDPIVCLKDYKQTTTTRPADAYCPGTYVGAANESAATIIYKVAKACNINPKVLLVTLQKEQGLVTHTWPSQYRYDKAMGFGCPDNGSGCQAEYFGFQNQVWRAARQFQRYRLLPTSYNYRAGVTNLIAYNPNTACGYQSVFIRNAATAGLYNYTPYVPNQAALNAIPGVGNSCSSYGNRNFWMYYWEWFGSPYGSSPDLAIDTFYESLDSAAKQSLGSATPGACAQTATWCHRVYQNGIIAWSQASGAQIVKEPILSAYLAAGGAGGALGGPTVPVTAISGPNGDGYGQRFANNAYIHASSHGAFYVQGAMLDRYVEEGWVRGHMGWPLENPNCASGAGCIQTFQSGARLVTDSTRSNVEIMDADMAAAYTAAGGYAKLGAPVILKTVIEGPNGNGFGMRFSNNSYVHKSTHGTFVVRGALLDTHVTRGWVRGALGWPTSGEECVGDVCAQRFQGGALIKTAQDVVDLPKGMADAYWSHGGIGTLGGPVTALTQIDSPHGNGQGVRFANNAYVHSSAHGAFIVQGKMLDAYVAEGWVRGHLGWPTAAAVCDGSGCQQQFQFGRIVAPASGAYSVVPTLPAPMQVAVDAAGGTAVLGQPITALTQIEGPHGNGQGMRFANNAYVHSSAHGAFIVQGKMLDAYVAEGWVRGHLGWPTAAAVCDGSGCQQQFQFGRIVVPTSGQYSVFPTLPAAMQAAVDEAGGTAVLGLPVTALTQISGPHGNGQGMRFANNAYVHLSARGAFIVQGKMLDAYVNEGWVRGQLGWPVSSAECVASGDCVQYFQYGAIALTSSGQSTVIPASIATEFKARGGIPALGMPTIRVATITGPHGNGTGQRFAKNAYIHAGPTGTFLVQGAMLDRYVEEGWVRGRLGWPKANAVCGSTSCTQQFQYGQLVVSAS